VWKTETETMAEKEIKPIQEREPRRRKWGVGGGKKVIFEWPNKM